MSNKDSNNEFIMVTDICDSTSTPAETIADTIKSNNPIKKNKKQTEITIVI